MRSIALGLVILAGSAPAFTAQTPRPATDAQTISRGWAALAAGRVTEAVTAADSILKKKPRSHAAFTLKIEALSSGTQPLSALDVYEAWMPKAGWNVDDRGLLQPIATGLLRVLSTDQDRLIHSLALEFLAKAGDDEALATLRKQSAEGDAQAMLALVARGDTEAIAGLQTFAASPSDGDLSSTIRALTEHRALTPALVQKFAKDRVPMNKAAVAEALAARKDPEAAQLLDSLSQEPDPFIRLSVTLARAKNGDEAALSQARALLASEVADIRLMAAEALAATLPQESEQAVRPLLTNRDGIYRFRAAAIVGRTDPAAVQSTLIEGLADDNPLIQQEAARIATERLSGNIVLLRQLLRHRDRMVVVRAAGAIIRD